MKGWPRLAAVKTFEPITSDEPTKCSLRHAGAKFDDDLTRRVAGSGPAKLVGDEQARAHGEEGDGQHDRQRGGRGEAAPQRARPHVRSMNPTPRTVWISGGSPSLRRSRAT